MYAETDFLLALIKDEDWLGEAAETYVEDHGFTPFDALHSSSPTETPSSPATTRTKESLPDST
jgi:hypothetical protein